MLIKMKKEIQIKKRIWPNEMIHMIKDYTSMGRNEI
jgi:hypothetical protein